MDHAALAFLLLAVISLASVVAGRPWTVIVARRTTPAELWDHPLFRETNVVMSLAWSAMFGISALVFRVSENGAIFFVMALLNTGLGMVSPWLAKRYAAWRETAYRDRE
ncbi:hypothetical protein D6850_08230 [Roseovarius spongiae]|uniref:SdpI family protein n=1 Tax=Roseovarius spongiae TaxID=2320272 RepID=A0A3A8AUV4_9RHOB|nr:hypothetical protein [Roseovarius spongiae]RKF14848.1 hypothetical protein D6850_08230 [Roseovarius spongiae]